ncbi:uncharacterized protein BDR25DRAFT_298502 [Lindgomyces ingoldianus]|uniref:Uncharacterized protein n=1 Tax=Lindgomyces ingoldianus TaxID=673940 RepID=A0ACB6Q9I2_9PLEO|nr:uncharacterized protein BDR25DRAFT_298502 [Lindgomyces ingoldianus]KAF2463195.1 hypothetical protein BDR25DRAFT_298502 [Lindgomyces ingoldianus]
MVSLKYGLGLHIWDQKPEWATPYYKMAFGSDILFPISCSLTKISLCLTYLRLFPSGSNKIFCYALSTFVTLYTAACIFLMLFQCTPIRGYWDASAKQHCINLRATLVSIAALNSLSDFLIYLWPAKPLWSLHLPLKQRIGLISIFAVGCTVCVAGICRMYYLEVYFDSFDLYWHASIIYAVMAIEMNLGIICGCMSGVKPVLTVIFPRLFASSYKTNATRPTHYGRTTHAEAFPFPFLSLSDTSNLSKVKDRKLEHAVSIETVSPENTDRRNYAWASSSGSIDRDVGSEVPMNAIAVNQVVIVHGEAKEEIMGSRSRSQKSGKGDGGSEEWIMGHLPAHSAKR